MKEYFENGRKLGPAYFEDSAEFLKEIEAAIPHIRQATFDVFVSELMREPVPDMPPHEWDKARNAAFFFAEKAVDDLRAKAHDATLALASVEAGIGLLDFRSDGGDQPEEFSGEDFQKSVIEKQKSRQWRLSLQLVSEFLFSVHPALITLYSMSDLNNWAQSVAESMKQKVKRHQEAGGEAGSVKIGRIAADEAAIRRFLAGNPGVDDYDVLSLQMQDAKCEVRKRLAGKMIEFVGGSLSATLRDELVQLEGRLSLLYQFERLLEGAKAEHKVRLRME